MHITVVGKVSTGKSSFINSFHSILWHSLGQKDWKPIATVSLQRETFYPTEYVFAGSENFLDYGAELMENKKLRENPANLEMSRRKINISPKSDIFGSIVDYPGFDDSTDKRDIMADIGANMRDITIFVVDAYRPFLDKSEWEHYEKILEFSRIKNELGIYSTVIVVVNKFDFIDDEDLNELYKKMNCKAFRWCSYAAFRSLDIKEKSKAQGVSAPCDIDNLMGYLLKLDIQKEKLLVKKNFILNREDEILEWDEQFKEDPEVRKKYTQSFAYYKTDKMPVWAFVKTELVKIYKESAELCIINRCRTNADKVFDTLQVLPIVNTYLERKDKIRILVILIAKYEKGGFLNEVLKNIDNLEKENGIKENTVLENLAKAKKLYEKIKKSKPTDCDCMRCDPNTVKLFKYKMDLRPFSGFIKENYQNILGHKHIHILKKCCVMEGWELIESFHQYQTESKIKFFEFPIETLKYWDIDIKDFLRECYLNISEKGINFFELLKD